MFVWNSAAHQQWQSTPQNNHAAYANPIDSIAQVAAFVLESQRGVLHHNAAAPLDVMSRSHQQRSKLQPAGRSSGGMPVPTTAPVVAPAVPGAGAPTTDESPQTTTASSAGDSPSDWNGGPMDMDVSPVLEAS
jgi:hypothetical protein